MPGKSLPERPNLAFYKKQAKELFHAHAQADPAALDRIARYHHRLLRQSSEAIRLAPFQLADAQIVIAREHEFASWPEFARHITTLRLNRETASLTDPVSAFIEAACSPRDDHRSGTVEEAEAIRARYPQVAASSIYSAALLGDAPAIRSFLAVDPTGAAAKGGPMGWDPLTYLCFSRYLRLDRPPSQTFVTAARTLLDAGASPNTGWIEIIDSPNPRPILESAVYGAAGVAQHAGLTRLLLERGADPNDEETAYHVIETSDNTVLSILLESGKFNGQSLATALLRKCDWHDLDGLRLLLEHGADPNWVTRWGYTGLHQALRRDNRMEMIELLIDRGADATLPGRDGRSALLIAARRGRADALELFENRGTPFSLTGVDALIAACALDHKGQIRSLPEASPSIQAELVAEGGTLLAEFSGNGNLAGVRNLLDLGVSVNARYREGDGYYGIAKESTALHVAAWRAQPNVVKDLIARGAPVGALDGQGRTALQLAVKACVDSYWTRLRSPQSVAALLEGGASTEGIELPTGYDEIDALLEPAIKPK